MVVIHQHYDEHGKVVEVSVSTIRNDGHRVSVGRDFLHEAMGAATHVETKGCGQCGLKLPLGMFSRDAIRPDGRFPYCRTCESRRVKDYKIRRKSSPPSSNESL